MTLVLTRCSRLVIGSIKLLPGQGMPSHRHHEMGDLIVQINVKFPDHIDPEQLGPLETILPPRRELPTFPDNIHIDEHVELLEASERKARSADPNAMDEDDEEGGGPQVQCAQQ